MALRVAAKEAGGDDEEKKGWCGDHREVAVVVTRVAAG
nr:hypothetical protein [Tanacetum cinerariifolium]